MIDVIAEAEGISLSSMRFKAMFGKGTFGYCKYQTFEYSCCVHMLTEVAEL